MPKISCKEMFIKNVVCLFSFAYVCWLSLFQLWETQMSFFL